MSAQDIDLPENCLNEQDIKLLVPFEFQRYRSGNWDIPDDIIKVIFSLSSCTVRCTSCSKELVLICWVCFADRDAELSVGPARLRGQRPADPGAGRKSGVLSQSVDTPPDRESSHITSTQYPKCSRCFLCCCRVTHGFFPPQAIENFAMTVKTTAQMLQKFGTDLAETELPNDVQCTKDLLTAHTDKHDNLKVTKQSQNTRRRSSCWLFGNCSVVNAVWWSLQHRGHSPKVSLTRPSKKLQTSPLSRSRAHPVQQQEPLQHAWQRGQVHDG